MYFPSHLNSYYRRIVSEGADLLNHDKPIDYKLLKEQAISEGLEEKNIDYDNRIQQIEEMNEYGKIITITGSDAINTLNQLQRESASIGRILETFEGIADTIKLLENGTKLKLTTAYGESIYLNLNEHVQNLISNYSYEHMYDKK